jgi:hypothetical protein
MSEAELIRAAQTLALTLELGEDEQVAALRRDGFDEGQAWRLATLLPIAFSRPVLEDLGVRHFGSVLTAQGSDGTPVRAALMQQPEYVGALKLARAHRRTGVMDHAVYKRIAGSAAEIEAVSKAVDAGADINGAAVASSLIGPGAAPHLVR